MKHFSKLNADNIVIEFATSDIMPDGEGWIETSYPNFIKFDYNIDGQVNNVLAPKPYEDAKLNNQCVWE